MIAYEYQHQPNAHLDPDMGDIRSSRYSSNHVIPGKNRDHKFRTVLPGYIIPQLPCTDLT